MERTQTIILVSVAVVMAIVVSALILVGGNREEKAQEQAAAGDLPGLQETAAPWQPEYKGLPQRIQALRIPAPGREIYHVHARIKVYIEGKEQPVPPNIGVASGTMAALHTHDADGTIHLEADRSFQARLADFFVMWGVKFSNSQIGSYRNEGDRTVQVYVNGQPVADPAGYEIQAKDSIVVGYGAPGSFPTAINAPFPEGL